MDNNRKWTDRIMAGYRYQQKWKRVAALLSCVVAVLTVSALTFPAVTLNHPICGIEEHTHGSGCWSGAVRTQVCGDGFQLHTHDPMCFDENGTLNCTLPEIESHMHDDSCWKPVEVVTDEGHIHADICYTMVRGGDPICGMEESAGHEHGYECLADGTELICTQAETNGHAHGDSCYVTENVLQCTLAETEAHVHEPGCYASIQRLNCPETEAEPHTHGDGCYLEAGTYKCGVEDSDGHTHTDRCYGMVRGDVICTEEEREPTTQPAAPECICGKEEVQLHVHDSSCYGVDAAGAQVLLCTQREVKAHQHDEACFAVTESAIICGLQEHTHEDACYADTSADEETPDVWEATLPQTLTGNWAEDLVAVVQSQLGYAESQQNYYIDEQEQTHGYSRYGAWVGDPYGQWNRYFAEFCLHYAGDLGSVLGYTGDLNQWIGALHSAGLYGTGTDYLPQPGDVALFDTDGDGAADKLGIVTGVGESSVSITAGDEMGTVAQVLYGSATASILGYGRTGEAYRLHTQPVEPEVMDHAVEIYTDDTYAQRANAAVTLIATAALPEVAVVKAYPVDCTLEDREFMGAYAICVFLPDGETYIPDGPVQLTVKDLPAADSPWEVYRLDAQPMVMAMDSDAAQPTGPVAMNATAEEDSLTVDAQLPAVYGVARYVDYSTVAEQGNPEAVQALVDSGYFTYWQQFLNQSKAVMTYASSPKLATAATGVPYAEQPSGEQIVYQGGTQSSTDGVEISKNIAGTELENVFDITLTVKTTTDIEEYQLDPDMAVVVVMDISNTMNSVFSGSTRYKAAMDAAEAFIDKFAGETNGISRVGYVAFNTNAHEIFGLSSCKNTTEATTLKNTMRSKTGVIISASDYGGSHSRFTNIEGGLKMAYDMLANATNEHKYIIFLSDGFPTTYLKSGYTGYDPYCTSGTLGNDGVFGDMVWGGYSRYGTSYSDKAAIRARQMSEQIESTGTKIFSIGVDVGGQTIERYLYTNSNSSATYNGWAYKKAMDDMPGYYWKVDASGNREQNPNRVVDRGTNVGVSIPFEIGSATDTNAFKNWLRNGIGSGYYYDSTNTAGLMAAYEQIFEEIKNLNQSTNQNKWIATDPMPIAEGEDDTTVEFVGFYDKNGTFLKYPGVSSLAGTGTEGGENTASYDGVGSKINWDLKSSGYKSTTSGSKTTYHYEVTYRVRLKNERSAALGDETSFLENVRYNTNGHTSLYYQVVTTTNGVSDYSDIKELVFPIPIVRGYLGELTFHKRGSNNSVVSGAEFTLTHDTGQCGYCRGDMATAVDLPTYTAVSGEDGVVTFTNIPSGHVYDMTETKVPDGFYTIGNTYRVVVSYDEVIVTEYDRDGKLVDDWIIGTGTPMQVTNYTSAELPATGGRTGFLYYLSGGAMVAIATTLWITQRKRRKGAGE